ncbi:MAG: PspC domain-containing protein [Paludibacter sp.]|nr:PspC domain-containing protein [Paludibacter sp.]
MNKKLCRSKNQFVAGVCAGFADYMGWDYTFVRLIYALLTFISFGAGLIIYLTLWIIMPVEE